MTLDDWLDLLERRHPREIDLGLDRCGAVFKRLGSPQPARKVFTVAGTNGKGSTVAYLAAISDALGQRYGCYTSPHIFQFNERINIMGEPVSDTILVEAFEQVETARSDTSLTYFEFTTLAALLILQQACLDCAILEVGLGGRLDTVNLVDTDCAIITPIGLDHQDFLGPDLASIAAEKAGIIRPGIPVVCTEPNPPAPIVRTAESLHATICRRDQDFDLVANPAPHTNSLQFRFADHSISIPYPGMDGAHQLDNLAVALAAMFLLNPRCSSMAHEIGTAIRNCRLPGRLQIVSHAPQIILDVGHNELAAEVVAAYLKVGNHSKVTCVLSMLADKPVEGVALTLGKYCKCWICADSPGSRGQMAGSLASRVAAALPAAQVVVSGGVDDAMQQASSAIKENETLLVFGSFTTVSSAAKWLQNSFQHGSPDTARIT